MDRDPELAVTLSNGRQLVTFQITPLDRELGAWTVLVPPAPRRMILGDAAALATRRHLDARIAARLAAGWVPVDPGPPQTPTVPLPLACARQLRGLLAAVIRDRLALRAADPSGQLWAACVTFLRQAQRVGVVAPDPPSRRAGISRRAARAQPTSRMTGRRPTRSSQLACRIDSALHATVRAQAARTEESLTMYVVRALEQAIKRSTHHDPT